MIREGLTRFARQIQKVEQCITPLPLFRDKPELLKTLTSTSTYLLTTITSSCAN